MPPTKGHLHLIQFASRLGDQVEVILGTQPGEPFPMIRYRSLCQATSDLYNVHINHMHCQIEQNPNVPGFWDMWHDIMIEYGAQKDDIVVASEIYGKQVADLFGGRFFPYDLDRDIYKSKARLVRDNPARYFHFMLPEFQHYMRQRVTFFGAESTGKTTLSKLMARAKNGHWLMEWARPYLEVDCPEITTEVMTNIWYGQRALQEHADFLYDKPWIFQDTDLFSTVGYWDFWDMNTPKQLVLEAGVRQSDLYIITKSNIPFEVDPIRYGGTKRESDDQFWIDLCEKHGLNYVVLESSDPIDRTQECYAMLDKHWKEKVADKLHYVRWDDKPQEPVAASSLISDWNKGLTRA